MKNYLLLLFAVIILFSATTPVFAASIFFESTSNNFNQGDEFLVQLFLDTEGESINATEGKIIFPNEILELKEIRSGNSIINFWVEEPNLEQAGKISFAGVIPGGLQQSKGFLFSAIFKTKLVVNSVIKLEQASALLNDGSGTQSNLEIFPFQFSISEEVQAIHPVVEPIKDADPPESFIPEIISNASIFNGKWFLVFLTQDKGSGIDYYQVCEGSESNCVEAKSPYLLKDQGLSSYIYVKAFDKTGNERIVSLSPRNPLIWYKNYLIWARIAIGALLLLISILLLFLIYIFCYNKLYGKRKSK
jgi:hypothetical protein